MSEPNVETQKKSCPYCGEPIALSAKKCRFCGEWLEPEASVTTMAPDAVNLSLPVEGEAMPAVNGSQELQQIPVATPPAASAPAPFTPVQVNVSPSQPVQPQQPTIINQTTVVVENKNEVNVKSDDDSSSSWLVGELIILSILVGFGSTWWAGVLTGVIGLILLKIPVIGHIVCVILGILCGMVAYGCLDEFTHMSTGALVFWSIFIGAIMIGVNWSGRKKIGE